ncbi:F-box/LRR-repeat protein 17-like [Schistocerca serialis cubense]|uniref:F-box/LRR-repeat protein 17-like n=1 Tax=Schistocerca serialis cubense TaxID=2023355 RepID=UPI00214E75B4|nr:F-box/LRR-repeat protein 17-like [Schistocerca serialis cubense]
MSSPGIPLRTSEDADTVFNSSVFPMSTADGDKISGVPLVSDLELNDRRHSEGDGPLRAASSTSKQDCRGTTVDDLPDELMLEIFSYVSFSENIKVLQNVCTRWRILAQDAHLWFHEKYIVRQETSEEEAIATFAAAPQLRSVILDKEVSPRVFEALSRSCPHLTTLEMNLFQMLTCSRDPHIVHFREGLQANMRLLDAVARLAHLRVLHIQHVEIADEVIPLRILAEGCPHICDSRLSGSCGLCYRIQDAEYFISSHKCVVKRLRTRLTSVEGRNRRLQKLQQLQLSYIVEEKMVCAVAEHCPDLQELELLRCEGHTDALFEPLHQLKKLETELEIDYCDGDQDVLDRISAQMPDLRVKGTLWAPITDDSYEEGDYVTDDSYEEGDYE